MSGRLALAAVAIVACAGPGRPSAATPNPADCQRVDSLGGVWRMTVFIDTRRVGDHLTARREQPAPETFELTGAEPPALAALRPDQFDLIQFSRGNEAERTFGLCPGYVAFLVTTRRRP